MTDKPKKVRRPKGERPKPNDVAEERALESMGGEMPADDSKKRRPKGERPKPNAKAEANARAKVDKIGEGGAAYIVADTEQNRKYGLDSKRGKLRVGQDVYPEYFAGGQETIATLYNLKLIWRKK